jgi:hypothetical protein
MRKLFLWMAILAFATSALAAFKAKPIKPKRPEQFQVRTWASGITIAADLLLTDKQQKDFFYQALNPIKVIPLRLAIFNETKGEVQIPLDGIQLIAPDGKSVPRIEPAAVAQAVLQGLPAGPESGGEPPVQVGASPRTVSTRTDPNDPSYDPRLDPTDPRYDPNDPRNRGYHDRRIVPGVDVILNPSGGGDNKEISARLIEKDFSDKAYLPDPVLPSMKRDRFLYFLFAERPADFKGFQLRLPEGRGFPQGAALKF